ncbi:predicted protein [Coccidioides posadasii str. Silveira]|uniref:Predicted protein n=1 Tax=Coccidioides posadasii (strain RMSCC 757 / Silveira) TaxID=443226 RepID=E9D8H3_COCPS|nr:predicted protein [Coccidioides posadasii str. Silveira]
MGLQNPFQIDLAKPEAYMTRHTANALFPFTRNMHRSEVFHGCVCMIENKYIRKGWE